MTPKEQVQYATGYQIIFNAPGGLFIEEWRKYLAANPPSEKAVEVSITCDDRTVEMTFEEFLERVGL